jgi:hypothetical protein
MKKRVNISIGSNLHQKSVAHADSLEMDFSELVAHLLRTALKIPIDVEIEEPSAVLTKAALMRSFQKLPPLGQPCPCGSGVKFKRCTCPQFATKRRAARVT